MKKAEPLNPITIPLNTFNLIEASAGTGKTHTIASLYIRLLLQAGQQNFPHPLSVEQILVVTFTEAATQELRKRIRERIYDTIQHLKTYQREKNKSFFKNDSFLIELVDYIPDIKQAINRLILAEQNMDLAAIYTIHGFCHRMLMQYAFYSSTHFDLELITNESILLERVANEFWRDNFYSQSVYVADFVCRSLETPKQLIQKIYKYISSEKLIPFTQKEELLKLSLQQYLHYLDSESRSILDFKKQWLQKESQLKIFLEKNKEHIKGTSYKALLNTKEITEWANSFQLKLPKRLIEHFTRSAIEKKIKKGGNQISHFLFDYAEKLHEKESSFPIKLKEDILLYHCIVAIKQKLIEYKNDHKQKGFNDLLRLVRESLYNRKGETLAQLISCQYPFAMIDEFQDTDAQQYDIFSKIYIEKTQIDKGFIIIGDPKQSIYKFRGADIFTYLKAAKQAEQHFTLVNNWRSSEQLIDCVNALFDFQQPPPFLFDQIKFSSVKAGQKNYLLF